MERNFLIAHIILQVDDDALFLRPWERWLTEAGYEVQQFSTLKAAVDAYVAAPGGTYYAVLCDGNIQNPNDGIVWAEKLLASGQNVVVLTSAPPVRYKGSLKFIKKMEALKPVLAWLNSLQS